MNIVIGADHAGFSYKEELKNYLADKQFNISDKGTFSEDSVDYPDFAHQVASEVSGNKSSIGILICGSANGVAITANRHKGIRAAVCWTNEIASLARKHNNANIICIPARFVSFEEAKTMTDVFIDTTFEQGRHQKRVEKIEC